MCWIPATMAQEAYSFSLDEAIQYALKNNYTVRNASLDIEAAEKQKWEATSFGLPQVDAGIDYQNWIKQQVSFIPSEIIGGEPGEFTPVVFGTKQNMNATVTVNQLIFDGSYLVGLQSAKTFLMISNLAKEKTDQTIREAVINPTLSPKPAPIIADVGANISLIPGPPTGPS